MEEEHIKHRDENLDANSKKMESSNSEEIIPEDILEAIPEEDRGKVASIIRQTMISGVMKKSNPLAEKMTSDHITQIITKSDEHDKRDREERKGERNYNLILILIALCFVGFLVVFLQTNEDLLLKIVIGIISFVGGFGFGKSRKKMDD